MIQIDENQIDRFAELLPTLPSLKPFDFCGADEGVLFPPKAHPGALNAFFFNAAHQFGFWFLQDNHYTRPMITQAGGVYRKGSDFLFYCTQRALKSDPDFFRPERLAALRPREIDRLFHDDHRRNPLPMWPEHKRILYEYADWFVEQATTPDLLVAKANHTRKPLKFFLDALREIPGYREDPLQKKSMLLAVILENRPERFLRVSDPESAVPIIDYHLQRSALRTGLVTLTDEKLRSRLVARACVDKETENAIRRATYQAMEKLVAKSGLSVAAIDYFFFTNRTRCPEMTEPACASCPVNAICKQDTPLFQPVFRTTHY
ncbi:MAG: hypothetical protein H7A43_00715 [Verrucomicrobia bacterium]|nr:hypothetical protein [Kiritimatiellia bacterium]MCP5487150.1 hypothetical protein [Verrucomicrobiota bacterium]